jgi:hypothetical protein
MVWHVFILCSCLIGCIIRSQCTSVVARSMQQNEIRQQSSTRPWLLNALAMFHDPNPHFSRDTIWDGLASCHNPNKVFSDNQRGKDWVIESTEYTKARKRHPMRRCVMSMSSSSDWSTVTGSYRASQKRIYSPSRPTKQTSLLVQLLFSN